MSSSSRQEMASTRQFAVIRPNHKGVLCSFQEMPPLLQHQFHYQQLSVASIIVSFGGEKAAGEEGAGEEEMVLGGILGDWEAAGPYADQ